MNKCLKLTMTAVAVVLMGGFVNEAKAGSWSEGDLAVMNLSYFARTGFNISEAAAGQDKAYVGLTYQGINFANPGANVARVWVGAVYTPAMGWAEMVMPVPKLDQPTYLQIPVVVSNSGFPSMIEVRFTTGNPLQGLMTRLVYFRVYTDTDNELQIKMWGGDVPGGDAFNESNAYAPPSSATKDSGDFIAICCGSADLFFGANLNLGAKKVADAGGGGVDLAPVNTALAAIEAKLDNLPAGPAGPQGDAGPTGAAGAAGAAGDAGAAGADAPCVECDEIADAAFALACKLLTLHQPTSLDEFRDCVGTIADVSIVGSGNNICAPLDATDACAQDIDSQVQAIFDDKF